MFNVHCLLFRRGAIMTTPADAQPVVFVIDDDESVRDALKRFFGPWACEPRRSGRGLNSSSSIYQTFPSCLVLDVRLPGLSGWTFQAELGNAHFSFRSSSSRDMAIFRCQ